MLPFKNLTSIFMRSIKQYGKDDGGSYAAALAFAAFFSIFPLILFLVSVASYFVDKQTATDWVLHNVPSVSTGKDNLFLTTVTGVIDARKSATGVIGILVGFISLLLSASGVFGTLETAVNRAWGCTKAGSLIKDKALAFVMVLGVGLVLLATTVIAAILNGLQQGTAGIFGAVPWLWQIVNIVVAIALMTGALTLLLHTVPRCKVAWADVWPGALLTAILFQVLQQAFGLYVGHFANYQAVYGALGGIIALETLIFLACQILIFGAEFTSEYATEREKMLATQGRVAKDAADKDRQAAADRRAADRERAHQARAAAPARAIPGPVGQVPPSESAAVVGAAAAVAVALGLLGRVLGGRNR